VCVREREPEREPARENGGKSERREKESDP